VRTNTSLQSRKKEKILELRSQNYTYREIQEAIPGLSKGSIAYHCGEGQKEKTREVNRKRQQGICSKVHGFIYDKRNPYQPPVYKLGPIRKKARGFTYGSKAFQRKATYKVNKGMLKHPIQKVWAYIGKVFPGIKSEKEPIPAVNQWTGEPDFEDGEQLVFPYMRCKLSGEVRNAKGSSVHADHIDGDRLNNHIDNFSFVSGTPNIMKGQMTYKQLYRMVCKIKTNLEKYKKYWNNEL